MDGYAVGGLAVGETHEEMYHILDEVVPYLPVNKPTYLMGVGTPANILEGVERGVDFFLDYPTRNGRHGHLYTNHGKINLFNAKYELDGDPSKELRVSCLPEILQSLYPSHSSGNVVGDDVDLGVKRYPPAARRLSASYWSGGRPGPGRPGCRTGNSR